MNPVSSLPFLIAGPMLRKATSNELVFWIVTSEKLSGRFHLYLNNSGEEILSADLSQCQQIKVGKHAFVTLTRFQGHFPLDECLEYEFISQKGNFIELCPHLLYEKEQRLSIKIPSTANYILHGSCRNPHHKGKDALIAADNKLSLQSWNERPDMLLMAGDQIYADHVAGPMMSAIVQVVDFLGLPNETFNDAKISSVEDLHAHTDCFYGREKLLPDYLEKRRWLFSFMPSTPSPVFSSRDCGNHLISFSEFFAMYLLVWSPQLWKNVTYSVAPKTLTNSLKTRWEKEKTQIEQFVDGLPYAHRLFAHLPTYMIFDDHDITDDWNLTIGWEKAAYENAFSKRIIGNGLLSYWLCQAWGNDPSQFNSEFMTLATQFFDNRISQEQNAFIQHLYQFEKWHYTIHTSPKVVVLDTRTRRWRSESKMNKPSGLMDWEALIEFQQELMNQEKVIVVSAAPMFGVKFIEALQKIATLMGQPLMIDAENWMAHPGSAKTLLSIFTHTKTPTHFVILSGDVHYSFAYDIKLRFRKCSPNIHQITCSGIKAQFPEPLLNFCDYADRLLYSPRSLLNYFTKRKRLMIKKRAPNIKGSRRLVNTTAIAEVRLDPKGKPKRISVLTGEGNEIEFLPTKP